MPEQTPFEVELPTVLTVNGIGEITADDVGLGESFIPQPTQSPLDSGEFRMDPQQKFHMPTLADMGIDHEGKTTVTTETFDADGNPIEPAPDASGLIGFAKKFLGTPYVWGGTNPGGFDCSGFVQYVYGKFGVKLPRISADQARAGARVGLDKLQVGDLVAWDNSSRNNGADHIAIYIGNGLIIEAPRPGSSVQVNELYDTGRAWGVRIKR